MNMVFQEPKCVISIGMSQDAGFTAVPDAIFISDMDAAFISTMFVIVDDPGMLVCGIFMPGMFAGMGSWPAANVANISPNGIVFTKISQAGARPLHHNSKGMG